MINRHSENMTHGSRSRFRGIAALELVLVLPVLVVLGLACVDLGRAIYYQVVLSNAARVGAEYAASHQFTDYTYPVWEANLREAVVAEASHVPEFDSEDLRIRIKISGGASGSLPRIRVRTIYPFETIVKWPEFPRRLRLRRQVTMQQYR